MAMMSSYSSPSATEVIRQMQEMMRQSNTMSGGGGSMGYAGGSSYKVPRVPELQIGMDPACGPSTTQYDEFYFDHRTNSMRSRTQEAELYKAQEQQKVYVKGKDEKLKGLIAYYYNRR